MVLTPREELLKIQQSIYRRNQKAIDESILIKEPSFERYEKAYEWSVRHYQALATIEEMMAAVRVADIIYVGDYHTLAQSQRSFLRILKALVSDTPKIILGLELLHKRNQKVLDRFLAGKMSDDTFLKKVSLKKRWVFDLWENFKPIFDFAHYHHVPVFGVDAAPEKAGLYQRDQESAKVVAHLTRQYPDHKIFVLIGDLHLAPQHLPGVVRKQLALVELERRHLILYQNSEPIYYQLARQGLEDRVEVVRVDETGFCRMHTPPVVVQRSYLNWLEHEEGEIDYADAKQSFMDLVHRISQFLKIEVGKQADRVEVYTSGDLSFLGDLQQKKIFSPEELKNIKRQIQNSESYYIAKTKTVYLANLSINHAAEEAAHFIKHICAGEEKPRAPVDAFYANLLHEALGFFGSKLINHKRKCFHETDFEGLLRFLEETKGVKGRELEAETTIFILEFKRMERAGEVAEELSFLARRMDLFFATTHALGYMLGEKLYYALVDGVVSKTELRHLFYDPWRGDGKPLEIYWRLVKKLAKVKIPKRM